MKDNKRFCRVPVLTRLNAFQLSLMATRALRPTVAAEFLPLFDHLIGLAISDYRGYQAVELTRTAERPYNWAGYRARRAGRLLRQARDIASKYPAFQPDRDPCQGCPA